MPIILATQEAVIRRITIRNKPKKIGHETLSQKYHKKRMVEWQGVGPEFKSQYHKKRDVDNGEFRGFL
jgi:hypothetical protein